MAKLIRFWPLYAMGIISFAATMSIKEQCRHYTIFATMYDKHSIAFCLECPWGQTLWTPIPDDQVIHRSRKTRAAFYDAANQVEGEVLGGSAVRWRRPVRTGEPKPPYRVSPGISREVLERPLSALKGHSGVLACGGVSHKADDIPTPPPKPP